STPPSRPNSKSVSRYLGSALRLSRFTLSLMVSILLIGKNVLHGHPADPGQLQRQRHRGGVVPPLDLADGLAGHPRQSAHLLLVDPQPGPVLLQPVVQRHPPIPFLTIIQ